MYCKGFVSSQSLLRLFSQQLTCAFACVLVLSCLFSSGSAGAQASAQTAKATLGPLSADHVEVELVSKSTTLVAGQASQIGLRLKHDKAWHTYWRNAGDSGLPTQFKYTLPTGVTASPVNWPNPTRIGLADLANYALEGELVIPVSIQVPSNASGRMRIELLAQWLVCRDICIPGEAFLALELPVSKSGQVAIASNFAPLFDQHARNAPSGDVVKATLYVAQPASQSAVQPALQAATVSLQLPRLPSFKEIEFFPYVESWIVPTADQLVFQSSDGVRIDLKQSLTPATPDLKLPLGILVIDGKSVEVSATSTQIAPIAAPLFLTTKISHFVELKKGSGLLSGQPSTANAGSNGGITVGAASDSSAPASTSNSQIVPSVALPQASLPTAGDQPIVFAVAILFALIGGLLLNLMPCVFPVLGIKLLAFAQEPSKMRRHVLFFSVGILATFLGLAAMLLGLRNAGEAVGWGFQMQSPIFVAFLALLFVALGLNLSGVFELGTRIAQLGNDSSGSGGNLQPGDSPNGMSASSAFSAGVLAVVVATPCSAPLMGSALGYTLSQSAVDMFAVFLAMGIGLALPYMILAMWPALLARLPRPGAWMKTFKELLAFPMYLTTAWLVWVFGLQTSMDAVLRLLCAAVLIGVCLWLFGRWQYSGKKMGLTTRLAAPLLALSAGLLAWDASQSAAPISAQLQQTGKTPVQWASYSDQAVLDGLAQGKTVFVDFTAAWCISCQANKKLVLETDDAKKLFVKQNVVTLRADWTKRDPVITAALAKLSRNAVPVYVVYRPGSGANVLPEVLTFGIVEAAVTGK